MNFEEYKDSLNATMYEPLPKSVANAYAMNNENLDQLVNSVQRLVIKGITSNVITRVTPDDLLFELVQVGNEAIAYSIKNYNHDKLDFAYFCFITIINYIKSYLRRYSHTVRATKMDKEYHYATYVEIDAENEDMSEYEGMNDEEYLDRVDLEFVYKQLASTKHPVKRLAWDIYVTFFGLDDGVPKSKVETAEMYNTTHQNIHYCVNHINARIRNNEAVMEYLKEFIDF